MSFQSPMAHRGSSVSLPIDSVINISLTGKIIVNICVNLYDSVSSIFEIINTDGSLDSTWRIIYNGQVLCPAISLAFYGIKNNASLIVASSNSLMDASNCQRRLKFIGGFDHRSSYNMTEVVKESQRVKKYFFEKCDGIVKDPDELLQRFQDAMNPMTMRESARLTDVCRDRIEANTKSFRKLCTRYYELSGIERSKANSNKQMNEATVLPEKPSLPSTSLLPEISSLS